MRTHGVTTTASCEESVRNWMRESLCARAQYPTKAAMLIGARRIAGSCCPPDCGQRRKDCPGVVHRCRVGAEVELEVRFEDLCASSCFLNCRCQISMTIAYCRVGVELERVEVRFEDLRVSATATPAGRVLPSIFNSYRNFVEVRVLLALEPQARATSGEFVDSATSVPAVLQTESDQICKNPDCISRLHFLAGLAAGSCTCCRRTSIGLWCWSAALGFSYDLHSGPEIIAAGLAAAAAPAAAEQAAARGAGWLLRGSKAGAPHAAAGAPLQRQDHAAESAGREAGRRQPAGAMHRFATSTADMHCHFSAA